MEQDKAMEAGSEAEGRRERTLGEAAGCGDMETLAKRIAQGAPLDALDSKGRSALGHACWRESAPCVEALLAAGADPNARGPKEEPPLHIAGRRGARKIIGLLAKAGAQVERQFEGMTALESAAKAGSDKGVAALLDAGADARVAGRIGWTPLMSMALAGAYVGLGRLARVSDLSAQGPDGQSALGVAAGLGSDGALRCAVALLDCGAGIEQRDGRGRTPLAHAAHAGHDRMVGALLGRGADPLACDSKGESVLSLAVAAPSQQWRRRGDAAGCIARLVKAGADPREKCGKDGVSLLAKAAAMGLMDQCKALLDCGADPLAKDRWGLGPLHGAARGGHVEVAKALMEAGADALEKDSKGATVVDYAKGFGRASVAAELASYAYALAEEKEIAKAAGGGKQAPGRRI